MKHVLLALHRVQERVIVTKVTKATLGPTDRSTAAPTDPLNTSDNLSHTIDHHIPLERWKWLCNKIDILESYCTTSVNNWSVEFSLVGICISTFYCESKIKEKLGKTCHIRIPWTLM